MHVTFSEVSFSPTSGSAESKQLVTLQLAPSAVPQGAFQKQGATDGAQQPLWNEQSFSAHHWFIHSHCAPSAAVLCVLKPDWSEKQRILYVQEVDLISWRARIHLNANIFMETSSDEFILTLGSHLSCGHDKYPVWDKWFPVESRCSVLYSECFWIYLCSPLQQGLIEGITAVLDSYWCCCVRNLLYVVDRYQSMWEDVEMLSMWLDACMELGKCFKEGDRKDLCKMLNGSWKGGSLEIRRKKGLFLR